MNKKIYRFLIIVILITITLLCALCYYVLRVADNADVRQLAYDKLSEIEWNIDTKQKELDSVLAETNKDNIAKAKSIALILSQSETAFSTPEELEGIRMAMEIDEIIITDKAGNVENSTSAFAQYNISDLEKYKPFMEAVNSKSFSKAVNTIGDGEIVQCIGVSRRDADGLIYIEATSRNLANVIKLSGISSICAKESILSNGVAFIVDKDEWLYRSHSDVVNVGQFCQYPKPLYKNIGGSGDGVLTTKVQGKNMRVYYREKGDYVISISVPVKSIYRISKYATIAAGICMSIAAFVFMLSLRKKFIDYKIQ